MQNLVFTFIKLIYHFAWRLDHIFTGVERFGIQVSCVSISNLKNMEKYCILPDTRIVKENEKVLTLAAVNISTCELIVK